MLLEMLILIEDPCVFQEQIVAAAFLTHSLQHKHNRGKVSDTLLQALTEWAPSKVNLPISWLIPAPAGIQGCLQIHSTGGGGQRCAGGGTNPQEDETVPQTSNSLRLPLRI